MRCPILASREQTKTNLYAGVKILGPDPAMTA